MGQLAIRHPKARHTKKLVAVELTVASDSAIAKQTKAAIPCRNKIAIAIAANAATANDPIALA